jgi:hypothetical protein
MCIPMPTAQRCAAGGGNGGAPVTLSYLDVVIEGFWTEFGPAGVARFFESTTGWAAVLDDRSAPSYPRARPVARALRDMTDSYLDRLNVSRLKA